MAAGILPSPGTELGPCKDACEHRDCATTREMAGSVCHWCAKEIGYDVRFYQMDSASKKYVHASCEEDSGPS